MKWKKGVDKRVKPETAYWMAKVDTLFYTYFGQHPTVTSAYREGDTGAHGRKEGWDLRRHVRFLTSKTVSLENHEGFCHYVQREHGKCVGVALEPEWGKGAGYTAPHYHFQLKKPALWK